MVRNKDKTEHSLAPPTHIYPFFSFTPSLSVPPQCHRGMGNGACSQSITAPLCHPFLLTHFPCSSAGSLPQDTVLWDKSAPMWAPLHRLRFLSGALSSVGSPDASWKPLLERLGLLLPSFSSHLGACWALSHRFFLSSNRPCSILPFLKDAFPRGTTSSAEELSHVLRWVPWSCLGPAMSVAGQPQPLLTEAALQPPPASASNTCTQPSPTSPSASLFDPRVTSPALTDTGPCAEVCAAVLCYQCEARASRCPSLDTILAGVSRFIGFREECRTQTMLPESVSPSRTFPYDISKASRQWKCYSFPISFEKRKTATIFSMNQAT